MQSALTFSLLLLAAVPALAQSSLTATPGPASITLTGADIRPATSLDGDWHFIPDPYFTGLFSFHGAERKDGWFLDKHWHLGDNELLEYDFATSPTLRVPGDWNTQRPELFLYEGPLWYERTFSLATDAPGHRTFLHAGAANYQSFWWVNGQRVCDHEGGYTTFDCEVTAALHPGQNSIVVAVDDTRRPDGLPTVKTDWYNYGGLTRSVFLVDLPPTFIEHYDLHLDRATRSRVEGFVQLSGDQRAGAQVTVAVPELHATTTATTGPDGRAAISLPVPGVALWSPESPKLYNVDIKVPAHGTADSASAPDAITDHIGFRTVETRGSEILLNGEPIVLRGVSIHAEAPIATGRVTTQGQREMLLGWAKGLGCNYVRLAHYPHDEQMTRLADKLGLLVWSEVPVYWAVEFSNPEVLAKAKHLLHEEIDRDQNRASIILWSIANETPDTAARTVFLSALADEVHHTDPSRLVTAALLVHSQAGHTGANGSDNIKVIDDALGKALDVIGFNEYIGWYEGAPDLADRTTWKVAYNKPLIVSEFGGGAKAGLHGSPDTRWTEEYQSNLYTHQLAMLNKIPTLRGLSPWVLMDFRSPSRMLPGIQDDFNRKGLVSDQGKRKLAFSVLEHAYHEKSIGHAQ